MNNRWRKVQDVITYYGKGVTPKYVNKSSIIVLNQKCIRNNRIDISFAQFIDDSKSYNEDKILKVGDILINSTGQGTAGRIAIVESIPDSFSLIVDSHILVLRTKNFYESKCLNYSLFSIESLLQTYIDGSTGQGELDKVRLFNILVNYPDDMKEQRKIVSFLSALDDKIELNNKISTELDQMAKTLYNYWFVQFDFPDSKGKPYKSSGGKMVYNDVLKREVPKSWEVSTFADWIKETKTGDWGKDTEEGNYKERVFCVRGADINGINGKGPVKAPERFILKNNASKALSANDFVIEISGGSPTQSTGRMALLSSRMFERFNAPVICSNFCKAISLKEEKYVFNFQQEWQRLYDANVFFGFEGKTSGIKNFLFDSFVNSYYVIIPPKEMVEKFYEFAHSLEIKKQSNLLQNQQLDALRDWLLPMLMNGQAIVELDHAQQKEPIGMIAVPEYNKQSQPNIPHSKKTFAKQVLAGKIISLFKDDPHFTDIKFQKIQFLAEHIIQADLNLNYYYQAAGPCDNVFMHTIFNDLKKNKWYDCRNRKFAALEKQIKIEEYYQDYFGLINGQLNRLFRLLSNATEAKSEIIATIYAVWNNFIIEGRPVADKELIKTFYDWSERKHQYTQAQILEGLEWLKKNHFEPIGFGKLIKKAKNKK